MTQIEEVQAKIERRMVELGRERVEGKIARALKDNHITETPGGLLVLRKGVAPAADAVGAWVEDSLAGKAGTRNTAALLLKDVDPELCAYITMRIGLNAAMIERDGKETIRTIAKLIQAEIVAAIMHEEKPQLLAALTRSESRLGSVGRRAKVTINASRRELGERHVEWDRADILRVGAALFEVVSQATGAFKMETVSARQGKRQSHIVVPGPGIAEWIDRRNAVSVLVRPVWMPTVMPPVPWFDTKGGGYYTEEMDHVPLVRKTNAKVLDGADLTSTYAAVNAIQRTPWRINKGVLEVMQAAWDSGANFPALPPRHDRIAPPRPADFDTMDLHAKTRWKYEAREVHNGNRKVRGARLRTDSLIRTATDYAELDALYMPTNLDWRGRAYSIPSVLSPQSDDRSRGLLEFAASKPVGDGHSWLMMHGANVFGNDKWPLADRIAWAEANLARAAHVAKDPMGDLWWTEADNPWQFLAWCLDATREDGMSSIPIALDGSCNGLQHYSALLRDPVGGAAVNLVPSDKPNDIYQEVAERTKDRLRVIANDPDSPDSWIARGWLDFGIDRKTTKRQVMVLPYGGTIRSCLDYTREAVEERIRDGTPSPFGEGHSMSKPIGLLATTIWAAIGDVVVAAREAMGWLQQVARGLAKVGLPVDWETPDGFPVRQAYFHRKEHRIRTWMGASFVYWLESERTNQLDPRRQALALPPNFIHSLDACAMRMTVNAASAAGIDHLAMIHDSYGTHAADTEQLSRILRQEFFRLYNENAPLYALYLRVKDRLPDLSPPPKEGSLDLTGVLDSPYFFA